MRAVMGTQPWTDAPALVFPAMALPLFSAAAMGALRGAGRRRHHAVSRCHRWSRPGGNGAGPPWAWSKAEPCTLVTNFIQQVLDTVFENLKLVTHGYFGGGKSGSFFVNLWDIAVSLAQKVVSGLVKAVGDAVVKPIVAAAGAATTLAEVVSYVTPWAGTVTALPSSVALGGNSGSFKAVVSSGGGVSYPSAVQDCAQALHIALPSLSAKGAKATWAVAGPISPTTSISPTLDAQGSNTLEYTTGLLPCSGPLPASQDKGYATISLSRPGISTLKSFVTALVSSLVGQAGALVKPVLQPLLDSILSRLDKLTSLSATGTVRITQPSGSDKSQSSCPCVVGTWRVVNETVSLAHESGGAGATWSLVPSSANPATGTATVDHDGSAPLVSSEVGISVQYSGTEVDSYSIPPAQINDSSGTWALRAVTGSVTAKTTFGGQTKTAPLPFDPGVTFDGSWTCQGDSMTTTYAGVGETTTLSRIGK